MNVMKMISIENKNESSFKDRQEISETGVDNDNDSNTIKANNNSVFNESINDIPSYSIDNKQITGIGHQNTDENSVNSEVIPININTLTQNFGNIYENYQLC